MELQENENSDQSKLIVEHDATGSEIQVVMEEGELDFSSNVCMFGGAQHKRFISNKIKICNEKEKEKYEKQLKLLNTEEEISINHATFEVFGKIPKLRVIEHPKGKGVFNPLRIRQYLLDGILHREEAERKASWMELFFDLIFVGVIGQLGHTAAHHLDGHGIWEYFIKFAMVWRAWSLQVSINNRFLTNDLYSKIYLLIIAAVAIGMSLNIGEAGISSVFIGFYLLNDAVTVFCQFVISLTRRNFLRDLSCANFSHLLMSLPAIASFAYDGDTRNTLLTISIILHIYVALPFNLILHRIAKPKHRTALNIEHWSERYGGFTIIVLCESVLAILYSEMTTDGYGSSVLGMIVAASIQWIYFDVDSAKQYLHAVRRSYKTGILWYCLHLPFHASIAFSGACLSVIIQDISGTGKYSKAAQTGYITSVGFIMFFMGLIGLTHQSLDKKQNRVLNISKGFRIWLRFGISIVVIIIGSVSSGFGYSPTLSVGLLAVMLFSLVVVEEWGRLETINCRRL